MNDEHQVYLQDEIKGFHAGLRKVTVLQIGPKWVRLRCGSRTRRIPYPLWVALITRTAKLNNRTIKPK